MSDQASIISTLANEATHKRALRIYRFRSHTGTWKHVRSDPSSPLSQESKSRQANPSSVKLITWNLDFETASQVDRINKALESLQFHILKCEFDSPGPCCILLQEITPKGFMAILDHDWVRAHFQITPGSSERWPGPYKVFGNITLVEKSIRVHNAAMYEYGSSKMERSAIQVDIGLGKYSVRILNTHLESMATAQNKSERLRQLKECAKFLKKSRMGGLIVGDLNPIDSDFDGHVRALQLHDAGEEDGETGHTWGDQRNKNGGDWPNARLDRILTWAADKKYQVKNVQRIGIGLRFEALWVSDHFGVMADVYPPR